MIDGGFGFGVGHVAIIWQRRHGAGSGSSTSNVRSNHVGQRHCAEMSMVEYYLLMWRWFGRGSNEDLEFTDVVDHVRYMVVISVGSGLFLGDNS